MDNFDDFGMTVTFMARAYIYVHGTRSVKQGISKRKWVKRIGHRMEEESVPVIRDLTYWVVTVCQRYSLVLSLPSVLLCYFIDTRLSVDKIRFTERCINNIRLSADNLRFSRSFRRDVLYIWLFLYLF